MTITAHDFQNMVRSLFNVDKADLDDILGEPMAMADWLRFQKDPAGFLLRCDATMARAIWAAVKVRQRPEISAGEAA